MKRTWPLVLIVVLRAGVCAAEDHANRIPARLTNVTVERGSDAVRVTIETTAAYRAGWVVIGNRLVVDFDNTQFAWADAPLEVRREPVERIRGSQFRKGVARIVVDLTRPVSYAIVRDARSLSITILAPETTDRHEAAAAAAGGVGAASAASRAKAASPGTASGAGPDSAGSTPPPAPADGARSVRPLVLPASAAVAGNTRLSIEAGSALDFEQVKRKLAQLGGEHAEERAVSPGEPSGKPVGLTLQDAIDIALQKNLGVQIAALAKESARREIDKAWAAFHPTVGYSLNASQQQPFVEGVQTVPFSAQSLTPFISQKLPTSTSLVVSGDFTREQTQSSTSTSTSSSSELFDSQVSLSIIQPLLRGGRTYVATKPVKDAEFDFRVAGEQFKGEILRVTARAKSAYYEALLAEMVIEVTNAAIERDKTLIEASNALFKARLVTKRDVFSAELILAQDSARLVSARADLENARNGLLDVLGLPIGTGVELLDREVTFEPVTIELERWIEVALKHRPDVLAQEQRLAKSSLNILVAHNGVLPQLDLVASFGRTATATRFNKTLDLNGEVWSAGLVFSIPIGNVAAKAQLAQAELEQATLRKQLEQTRRQVELDVRAATIKLGKSVERMKALTLAIEHAKGKLEVGRAQFALGQVTNLDITDAQGSLLNAETDLLTAIVDYKVGLAELEAAIGDNIGLRF